MYRCDVVLRMEKFEMKNPEVFKDKTLQDILEEIYQHAENKRNTIDVLMESLTKLIKKPSDAAVIVPVVQDLLEVGIKNDEHLVKIATIAQRILTAGESSSPSGEFMLSQKDRDELLEAAQSERALAEETALKELEEAVKDSTKAEDIPKAESK